MSANTSDNCSSVNLVGAALFAFFALVAAMILPVATAQHTPLGFMDYDVVKPLNLDRLIGATEADALQRRLKIDVAAHLAYAQATSPQPRIETFNTSICDPQGLAAALDYDVIFSCVDRPWPRAVLNSSALTDLLPVIDGGIAIDASPEGGMRERFVA
jgi:molybdopterin-synthase adenylyltransferase